MCSGLKQCREPVHPIRGKLPDCRTAAPGTQLKTARIFTWQGLEEVLFNRWGGFRLKKHALYTRNAERSKLRQFAEVLDRFLNTHTLHSLLFLGCVCAPSVWLQSWLLLATAVSLKERCWTLFRTCPKSKHAKTEPKIMHRVHVHTCLRYVKRCFWIYDLSERFTRTGASAWSRLPWRPRIAQDGRLSRPGSFC